ncbi:MAG: hypothetical protein JXR53_01690 [Bacteroidales bacterium]|nr:hypothetical protein [Bacteroidales bacterium]
MIKISYILFIFVIFALLSSCRYGRPLISWKREAYREYQGDTIYKTYSYYKVGVFRAPTGAGGIIKCYYENGELESLERFRNFPQIEPGHRPNNIKAKWKVKTYDNEGNLTKKEIFIGWSRWPAKARVDKTITFEDGKRVVVNHIDTVH